MPPPLTLEKVRALHRDPDLRWKIPLDGAPRLGAEKPLATIVVFGNLQCPGSRISARWSREKIEAAPEDVALVWRDDPVAMHQRAQAASHLVREAGAALGPDAFWKAARAISDSRKFDDASLSRIATDVGLPPGAFEASFAERRHRRAIDRDIDMADGVGASTTPTLFVNGRRYIGPPDEESFKTFVDQEVAVARALVERGVPRDRVLDEITSEGQGPLPPVKARVPEHQMTMVESTVHPVVMVIAIGDHSDPYSRRQHQAIAGAATRRADVGVTYIEKVDPTKPESMRVATALLDAFDLGGPEGFKAFRTSFNEDPGDLTVAGLVAHARKANLNVDEVRKTLETKQRDADLLALAKKFEASGFTMVPTYVVCAWDLCARTGGYVLEGFHSERSVELLIDRAFVDARSGR